MDADKPFLTAFHALALALAAAVANAGTDYIFRPFRREKVCLRLSGDAWKYICYLGLDGGRLTAVSWELARRETIDRISVVANGHYRGLHDIEFVFDGDEKTACRFSFPAYGREGSPRMDFVIDPLALPGLY